MLTFDEARGAVRALAEREWPPVWPPPVILSTGRENLTYFRVYVERSDGEDIMDPPTILVDKRDGLIMVGPWSDDPVSDSWNEVTSLE